MMKREVVIAPPAAEHLRLKQRRIGERFGGLAERLVSRHR